MDEFDYSHARALYGMAQDPFSGMVRSWFPTQETLEYTGLFRASGWEHTTSGSIHELNASALALERYVMHYASHLTCGGLM